MSYNPKVDVTKALKTLEEATQQKTKNYRMPTAVVMPKQDRFLTGAHPDGWEPDDLEWPPPQWPEHRRKLE